ncbi:MAG: hypothetical protein LBT70_04140 [Holosporaceae bacterium]|jgi:hypothetical protein|nr:hypothetical protein [Holosporaceae bacterium]
MKNILSLHQKKTSGPWTKLFFLFLLIGYFSVFKSYSMELPLTYDTLASYINKSRSLREAVTNITTSPTAYSYHRSFYPTKERLVRSVMKAIMPFQAAKYVRRFRLSPVEENSPPMNLEEKWLFTALMLRAMHVNSDDNMLCIVNFDGLVTSDYYKDEILLKTYKNWDSIVLTINRMIKSGSLKAFDIDTQDYLLLCKKKREKKAKKAKHCGGFCNIM